MRCNRLISSASIASIVSACASSPPSLPAITPSAGPITATTPEAATSTSPSTSTTGGAIAATSSWPDVSRSPWPIAEGDGEATARERALAASCGVPDAALERVAREIALTRARGLGTPDTELVVAKLRAAGEPHPRPRVIVASGRAPIDETAVRTQLAARAAAGAGTSSVTHGPPRCGVAIASVPDGGEVLVALRVEALADLAPLPTRARTGEWLTFDARIHVGARAAKLIVLGPHGAPRTVPTTFDSTTGITRARFALDQPGAFLVQLVGDVAEGPRPMLEARIFADVPVVAAGDDPPAPGEDDPAAVASGASPAVALTRMVAALRSFEGFPALRRDAQLDAMATAHAERMRDRRSVAHDLGDGDFRDRFEAEATLDARTVGENVAHAPTVALAHRALHASPSHRLNLLRADFTHLGVGIAKGADGTVYVCETFASIRTRR